ncbi:MAG: LysR family transcriptional regulator [Thiohalocapsa sp.]|uniref:LysR family transcriptional regulator n=1 Tax=Thiohalocapsa sp. TaxID=2497641 RepID=UPI0025E52120|nr:LysR family transcriptional regulator [Thiohalocapsa sp.]MCG6942498.1 LysR family transcriptional regulator [Thiohalocapsa sp.]
MDRFRELETFIAVVEAGSFVKAARALRTSTTAVSRLVQDLETRLGGRLLQRTTRRLALTEAGRDYWLRARQILADLAEADGAVSAVTGRAAGLLRVSAPVSFGVLHLAPLWGTFLAFHPEVALDVTLNDRLVDLVEEGFDVAVRIAQMADSSLVSRRLASTRLMLCASPGYLATHGTPASLADLADHRVISYRSEPMGDTLTLWAADGPRRIRTRSRLHTNNGDTCRAAALDHQGIVLQPDFLIGADLTAGRLVRLLPELQGEDIGIYAVYPTRQHLSGKVRALVEFLATAFAQPSWGQGG